MAERARARRRYFTAARREIYLANLGRTGTHAAAAREAGMSAQAARRYRARTPGFEARCVAATAQVHARLAGAEGPFEGGADGRFESIRRGADGRLKIQAQGKRGWSKAVEDRIIAVLGECGNVAAAARAVGVSREAIWKRRRNWPAFARRVEEALEDAEITLEFRVACLGTSWTEAAGAVAGEPAEIVIEEGPLDHEFALRFLKWREDKRRGARGATAAPPPVEEVRARLLRKVQAMKRHRAREAERRAEE
jgi:molybdenum-dependent DNA-binding transcriptional regulator ModE